MVSSIPARIAADRDVIARADRVALNSLPAELAGRTPLCSPRDALTFRVAGLQ